ncbi:PAS/PAC sensor hybrid histidine kinase [Desulfatibacillum aliphaticivorans]|uniref:histidine kinase n=2 Tax=Desulfatibacillum aliphaticivorans TaxID=218208 RepID=B8FEI2_DESAL|nr:PAS/PAC sensor hybrid histidine kinase [Desulfatibacillum aliphaticivorans]
MMGFGGLAGAQSMHILSVPAAAAAAVILFSGLFHLFIYDRDRRHRQNLTFALTCVVFSLYGIACAGLYNSTSVAEGMAWQRAQMYLLFLSMIFFLWFVHDFTQMVPPKALWFFTIVGVVCLSVGYLYTGDLILSLSRPLIKTKNLPFGITAVYYEAELGPVMLAANLAGLICMAYILFVGFRFYKVGPKKKARFLALALFIMFSCVTSDIFVSLGMSPLPYTLEYGFLAITAFMTGYAVDQVVKASFAQEQLKQNEERYQVLADNAGFTMWTADLDLRLTHISPSIETLTGFTPEEALAMGFDEILTPESASLGMTVLKTQQALELENPGRSPGSVQFEVQIKRKNGPPFWAENTGAFLRDGSGVPIGVVGLTRDISSQKAAEEERLFIQRAVESSSDAIAMCDADFVHFYHNEAFANLFGYRWPKDLVEAGGLLSIFADPRQGDEAATGLIEQGSWTGEVMTRSNRGRHILTDLRANVVSDKFGNLLGLIGIYTDITEKIAVTKALKGSEERYRLVAENTNDVIWTTDLNLKWTYVSPSVFRMRGYTPEEVLQQDFSEVLTRESTQDVLHIFTEELEKELTDPEPEPRSIVLDMEFLKRDGGTVWSESACSFMRDDDGQVFGILGISRDITERRKAEEDRLKLEERLQQAQKLEAMGTLAGGVAHDFNNLLMGIQGNLSLMLLKLEPSNPLYGRIKNIEQHIKNATGLTRQLLGFARSGKYQVTAANLNDLVSRTSSMFGRTRKEIRIKENLQADAWPVEVDHGQIEQVLLNLLVNAWQAMSGGGIIYIRSENVVLDQRFASSYGIPPGKYVRLSVTDTGSGMSPEVRKRVFDPFFTTKEISRGTGLGLASAYGIIQNHGGVINVYSQEGQGATFNIYLPASSKDVMEEIEPEAKVVHGTETILLIDDEEVIITTGEEILRALGYQVFVARSPHEALEIFRDQAPKIDLVIMDMIMPEMQGIELYDHLTEIRPDVRVLLSSGYSLNGQASSIIEKGCDGFIQKPFNLEELSQKIREILD